MSTESTTAPQGLISQFKSFNAVFWISNAMEMFERLGYYGVRAVIPAYMVLAVESGGPEFDHVQKGFIFFWWAIIQSFVPVFSGAYADRQGYKLTVGGAIAIKIMGYLVMAFSVDIANVWTFGAASKVPGHGVTLYTFFGGAMLLALGTALFKPAIQGIIALQLDERNASTGWAVFYQLVNIGGFLGPFLAAWMRLLEWRWVFISCAAVVAINYLLLLTFKEPEKEVPPEKTPFFELLWSTSLELCKPRLMSFLVVFSGFWMMFYQLFDLLPNYIEDWVDSSMVLEAIIAPIFNMAGQTVPTQWNGMVPFEWMINLNAGVIMLLAFLVGYFTGKVKSLIAMIAGILVSAIGIYGLGISPNGWWILGMIAIFSFGEMMASPTKMRYFASIAPPGKKARYLGYVNATSGIGWAIGSIIAGRMYEDGGDKVVLARKYLVEELGQDVTTVGEMAKTTVLPRLAELTNQSQDGVRLLLWDTYDPSFVWAHFTMIGLVSMVGLIAFHIITQKNHPQEDGMLLVLTVVIAWQSYGLSWAAAFGALMLFKMVIDVQDIQRIPAEQGPPSEAESRDE